MTQLDFNVTSCMHNSDDCCCKSKIEVEGSSAKECCETCCGSYDKRGSSAMSNSAREASKATEVECMAKNCIYNSEGCCDAGHIGITGAMASSSEQTECGSFKSR